MTFQAGANARQGQGTKSLPSHVLVSLTQLAKQNTDIHHHTFLNRKFRAFSHAIWNTEICKILTFSEIIIIHVYIWDMDSIGFKRQCCTVWPRDGQTEWLPFSVPRFFFRVNFKPIFRSATVELKKFSVPRNLWFDPSIFSSGLIPGRAAKKNLGSQWEVL